MNDAANAGQIDFWNGEVGQRWLRREADLEAMNRPVNDHLLAEARLFPGARVVEIGCGSGGLALRLAGAVPEGEVVALDISAPLLRRARARRDAAGLRNLTFREADAQTAVLPGPFDLAVSAFGMMFFEDPVAAFANIRRAMRPHGRLLFATFAAPAGNPWFGIPRRIAAAHLGEPPEGPATAPGPLAFADGPWVTGMMRQAGWAEPSVETRPFDFHHPAGAAAAADLAVELGPAAFMLRITGASAAHRTAVRDAIEAAFASLAQDGGLHLAVDLNIYEARNG